ncbi:hypothetical protein GGI07_001115 [Coemansia sp. Benny D115]|nr:hypothetical protein GGI07_001115 [Coemansia sp. Benny D115]
MVLDTKNGACSSTSSSNTIEISQGSLDEHCVSSTSGSTLISSETLSRSVESETPIEEGRSATRAHAEHRHVSGRRIRLGRPSSTVSRDCGDCGDCGGCSDCDESVGTYVKHSEAVHSISSSGVRPTSLFGRCARFACRKQPQAATLTFALRRDPRYTGVMEVVDCGDMTVAYRKIMQSSARPWCESFHEVSDHFDPSRKDSGGSDLPRTRVPSSVDTSQIGFHGRISSVYGRPTDMPNNAASLSSVSSRNTGSSSGSQSRPGWQPGHTACPFSTLVAPSTTTQGSWIPVSPRHPRSYDVHRLWEISSPNPRMFAMHCRDARGVIDPVPLTSMVPDRHQFCFRFHLFGIKMRWVAARQKKDDTELELQCFVRNTVVAVLYGNGSGRQGAFRGRLSGLGKRKHSASVAGEAMVGTGSGYSLDELVVGLPSVVLLPSAFAKLAGIDSSVIESFVLFTGIEVYERFVSNA